MTTATHPYPDDVMRAARETLNALDRENRAARPCDTDYVFMAEYDRTVLAIARAILAERERCKRWAEIAPVMAKGMAIEASDEAIEGWEIGVSNARRDIAAAIQSGG